MRPWTEDEAKILAVIYKELYPEATFSARPHSPNVGWCIDVTNYYIEGMLPPEAVAAAALRDIPIPEGLHLYLQETGARCVAIGEV